MAKSNLQIAAQKRNSAKGRIKGLRNNLRGLLSDHRTPLTEAEKLVLQNAEHNFTEILKDWDKQWEDLKKGL